MFQSAFSSFSLIELPVLAMAVFMVTFTLVVVKVLRGETKHDDELQRLPLEDDGVSHG